MKLSKYELDELKRRASKTASNVSTGSPIGTQEFPDEFDDVLASDVEFLMGADIDGNAVRVSASHFLRPALEFGNTITGTGMSNDPYNFRFNSIDIANDAFDMGQALTKGIWFTASDSLSKCNGGISTTSAMFSRTITATQKQSITQILCGQINLSDTYLGGSPVNISTNPAYSFTDTTAHVLTDKALDSSCFSIVDNKITVIGGPEFSLSTNNSLQGDGTENNPLGVTGLTCVGGEAQMFYLFGTDETGFPSHDRLEVRFETAYENGTDITGGIQIVARAGDNGETSITVNANTGADPDIGSQMRVLSNIKFLGDSAYVPALVDFDTDDFVMPYDNGNTTGKIKIKNGGGGGSTTVETDGSLTGDGSSTNKLGLRFFADNETGIDTGGTHQGLKLYNSVYSIEVDPQALSCYSTSSPSCYSQVWADSIRLSSTQALSTTYIKQSTKFTPSLTDSSTEYVLTDHCLDPNSFTVNSSGKIAVINGGGGGGGDFSAQAFIDASVNTSTITRSLDANGWINLDAVYGEDSNIQHDMVEFQDASSTKKLIIYGLRQDSSSAWITGSSVKGMEIGYGNENVPPDDANAYYWNIDTRSTNKISLIIYKNNNAGVNVIDYDNDIATYMAGGSDAEGYHWVLDSNLPERETGFTVSEGTNGQHIIIDLPDEFKYPLAFRDIETSDADTSPLYSARNNIFYMPDETTKESLQTVLWHHDYYIHDLYGAVERIAAVSDEECVKYYEKVETSATDDGALATWGYTYRNRSPKIFSFTDTTSSAAYTIKEIRDSWQTSSVQDSSTLIFDQYYGQVLAIPNAVSDTDKTDGRLYLYNINVTSGPIGRFSPLGVLYKPMNTSVNAPFGCLVSPRNNQLFLASGLSALPDDALATKKMLDSVDADISNIISTLNAQSGIAEKMIQSVTSMSYSLVTFTANTDLPVGKKLTSVFVTQNLTDVSQVRNIYCSVISGIDVTGEINGDVVVGVFNDSASAAPNVEVYAVYGYGSININQGGGGGGLDAVATDSSLKGNGTQTQVLGINFATSDGSGTGYIPTGAVDKGLCLINNTNQSYIVPGEVQIRKDNNFGRLTYAALLLYSSADTMATMLTSSETGVTYDLTSLSGRMVLTDHSLDPNYFAVDDTSGKIITTQTGGGGGGGMTSVEHDATLKGNGLSSSKLGLKIWDYYSNIEYWDVGDLNEGMAIGNLYTDGNRYINQLVPTGIEIHQTNNSSSSILKSISMRISPVTGTYPTIKIASSGLMAKELSMASTYSLTSTNGNEQVLTDHSLNPNSFFVVPTGYSDSVGPAGKISILGKYVSGDDLSQQIKITTKNNAQGLVLHYDTQQTAWSIVAVTPGVITMEEGTRSGTSNSTAHICEYYADGFIVEDKRPSSGIDSSITYITCNCEAIPSFSDANIQGKNAVVLLDRHLDPNSFVVNSNYQITPIAAGVGNAIIKSLSVGNLSAGDTGQMTFATSDVPVGARVNGIWGSKTSQAGRVQVAVVGGLDTFGNVITGGLTVEYVNTGTTDARGVRVYCSYGGNVNLQDGGGMTSVVHDDTLKGSGVQGDKLGLAKVSLVLAGDDVGDKWLFGLNTVAQTEFELQSRWSSILMQVGDGDNTNGVASISFDVSAQTDDSDYQQRRDVSNITTLGHSYMVPALADFGTDDFVMPYDQGNTTGKIKLKVSGSVVTQGKTLQGNGTQSSPLQVQDMSLTTNSTESLWVLGKTTNTNTEVSINSENGAHKIALNSSSTGNTITLVGGSKPRVLHDGAITTDTNVLAMRDFDARFFTSPYATGSAGQVTLTGWTRDDNGFAYKAVGQDLSSKNYSRFTIYAPVGSSFESSTGIITEVQGDSGLAAVYAVSATNGIDNNVTRILSNRGILEGEDVPSVADFNTEDFELGDTDYKIRLKGKLRVIESFSSEFVTMPYGTMGQDTIPFTGDVPDGAQVESVIIYRGDDYFENRAYDYSTYTIAGGYDNKGIKTEQLQVYSAITRPSYSVNAMWGITYRPPNDKRIKTGVVNTGPIDPQASKDITVSYLQDPETGIGIPFEGCMIVGCFCSSPYLAYNLAGMGDNGIFTGYTGIQLKIRVLNTSATMAADGKLFISYIQPENIHRCYDRSVISFELSGVTPNWARHNVSSPRLQGVIRSMWIGFDWSNPANVSMNGKIVEGVLMSAYPEDTRPNNVYIGCRSITPTSGVLSSCRVYLSMEHAVQVGDGLCGYGDAYNPIALSGTTRLETGIIKKISSATDGLIMAANIQIVSTAFVDNNTYIEFPDRVDENQVGNGDIIPVGSKIISFMPVSEYGDTKCIITVGNGVLDADMVTKKKFGLWLYSQTTRTDNYSYRVVVNFIPPTDYDYRHNDSHSTFDWI